MEWGTGFGWVIINGVKYRYDVLVLPDGSVLKRKKELSKNLRKTFGHTPFSLSEFEDLLNICGNPPKILIIGSGQYGYLPVMEDVLRKAEELGIKVIVKRTPEALALLKKLLAEGCRAAGVVHVTC